MDKVIAVFGGTFNPIHNGHVEMAKEVLALNVVEKLIIMPTCKPPHKEAPNLASGEDRLNMCKTALGELDGIEFSDLELTRQGKSYTYDTVCALNEIYDKRIALVCGGDMITTFNGWYRYKEILQKADLIAFRRKGVLNTDFDKAVENLKNDGGKITVIDSQIEEISSSGVRAGEWNLIPQSVFEYIKQKGLYGVE